MKRPGENLKENLKDFFLCFFMIMLSYQGFYRQGFSADTITHYFNPLINIDARLQYGRVIPYLLESFLYKNNILLTEHYRFFYMMFVVVIAISAYITLIPFRKILNGSKKGIEEKYKALLKICLIFPFFSPYFAEFMMFPECFMFCFAFLLAAIALYCFTEKKYVLSALFLILGCFTYQIVVVLFAIYAVFYTALKEDFVYSNKLLIREVLISACSFIPGAINVVFMRILYLITGSSDVPKSIELGSITDIIKRPVFLLHAFLKDSSGLIPFPYLFFALFVLAAGWGIYLFYRRGEGLKALTFCLLTVATLLLSCAVPMIQTDAARILFPIYLLVGIPLATGIICFEQRGYFAVFGIIMSFLMLFSCQQIAVNHYISNDRDEVCAELVLDEINMYEENTGNTVKYIATCTDESFDRYYDNVYYTYGQINERVSGIVSYSLLIYKDKMQRNTDEVRFEKVPMKSGIYEKYFKGKNWDNLNLSQQMVIEGDTAYWCVF
ncbi:MAG: hypothetical protein E7301_01590 [Butyrivibrio sp.]|nr:hypothetical protein [Butyrivibrio sp.]